MSLYTTSTYRLSFTSQALATIGVDAAWDSAIANFLYRFALLECDRGFGGASKAEDAYTLTRAHLKQQFGEAWKDQPEADEAAKARDLAEQIADEHFFTPYEAALRRLAATPAPSIAAATFKHNAILAEEIWNHQSDPTDYMQIVRDDFARLAPAIEEKAA